MSTLALAPVDLRRWYRPAMAGLALAGAMWAGWLFVVMGPGHGGFGYDALAYWTVDLADLYGRSFGQLTAEGAFRYSPPVAVLFAPVALLPWPAFLALWTVAGFAATWWLARRWTLAVLAFPGVAISLYMGNVDVFLAVSAVLGMAHPAAWAFALLAKPTMAVGLLWFVARGEWRRLAIALAVTALVALSTVALAPDLWASWLLMLRDNADLPTGQEIAALWIRLPLAAGLTVYAARTDRPWLAGLALGLAQPLFSLRSATVGVLAAVALWRRLR